jgi:UDP-N-acetylmuramoylalanine--D-glutamate ligase
MAAITACKTLGISNEIIQEGIASFTGLEHRLEYVGEFHGIRFYNDSISTIPEATIAAVKTLDDVDTLILGGFDRGIDYSGLAEFLVHSPVRNLIFVGEAGRRINEEMKNRKEIKEVKGKKLFMVKRFDEFIDVAIKETKPGHICLLSPAAASYDEFPNFEIRGKRFKELIASNSTQ